MRSMKNPAQLWVARRSNVKAWGFPTQLAIFKHAQLWHVGNAYSVGTCRYLHLHKPQVGRRQAPVWWRNIKLGLAVRLRVWHDSVQHQRSDGERRYSNFTGGHCHLLICASDLCFTGMIQDGAGAIVISAWAIMTVLGFAGFPFLGHVLALKLEFPYIEARHPLGCRGS